MSPPPNMNMPPVPRDAQEASFSEMVPLRSTKINLKKSALLYVAVIAAIISVLGFSFVDSLMTAAQAGDRAAMFASFVRMEQYTTFVMLMLIVSLLYFYAKPRLAFWVCCIPAVLTYFIIYSKLFFVYYPFFDVVLPGHMPQGNEPADTFPMSFVHAFFGPGCREELTKGLFILFGAFLTFQVMKNPAKPRTPWIEKIRVTGPLDGVMLGIFAAAGFVMIETANLYVAGNAAKVDAATGNTPFAIAFGLTLLVPRVIEVLAGHMGYSAIFGYFIGLSVIRPKSRWKLIGMGYLIAAALHGAWDAVPEGSPIAKPFQYGFSVLTAILAVGVLLKARQLESLITGRVAETTGSIVVERPVPMMPVGAMPAGGVPPRPMPAAPMGYAPPPQGGYAPPPAPGSYPPPPKGAYPPPPAMAYAPPPPRAAPVAPAAVAPASLPVGPLMLDIDGLKLPLRGGDKLDLGGEPALGGRGAGVQGLIVPHPTRANVFGLKNTGSKPWSATLRDGSTQSIEGDRNIRLAPGVKIDFGDGLVGAVVPA